MTLWRSNFFFLFLDFVIHFVKVYVVIGSFYDFKEILRQFFLVIN